MANFIKGVFLYFFLTSDCGELFSHLQCTSSHEGCDVSTPGTAAYIVRENLHLWTQLLEILYPVRQHRCLPTASVTHHQHYRRIVSFYRLAI